jgi:hypothetical protein
MEDLEKIIGATILEVTGCERESKCVTFLTDRGTLRLLHRQNCCERVYLEDANGDISDLIGGVVSVAEERSNQEGERGEYRTKYTFYTIRTTKGDLDLRWIGRDNGYYGVSVDAEWEEPTVSEDTDPEEEHWKDLIRRAREAVPN